VTAFKRASEWILWLYLAGMTVFTFAGVGRLSYYGDEILHVEKIQTFLLYGIYSIPAADAGDFDISTAPRHPYSYGPLFTLIGHVVAVLSGAETWGVISMSDAAFNARHITVVAFSLIGVFAAGWGVSLVTRSRVWGVATSALLMSIPIWTGSALFNVKDIPIAAGFTLFTSACIAMTLPADWISRRLRIGALVAMYGGTLILWGVRPGTWPAVFIGFLAMLLINLRFTNFAQPWQSVKTLVAPVLALAASYLTMLVIYPKAFINPLYLLYRSFKETASFPHGTVILTDGDRLSTPPPWYYLPKWIAAQLPELLVVLLVVASIAAIWLVLSRLFRSATTERDFALPAIVFIFAQFAAFPLAAIVLKSTIYGGLRQFTFIVPALAMLIMIVLYLATTTPAVMRLAWLRPTVTVLLVASATMATVAQVQLFPYQSNYFNPTTVARGIDGRWDMLARKLSYGELYSELSSEQRTACSASCPELETFPKSFTANPADGVEPLADGYSVRFPGSRTTSRPIPPCGPVIASVTRPYLWTEITISEAYLCPIEPPGS
jgi:hypothetical protein